MIGSVRAPKTAELLAGQLRQRIARGELSEGDALPTENQLMDLFGVSRPILREAFRILESESLIEVRRGVRGGARVCLPDASAVARSTALLLQLQGTTLSDVLDARGFIEPIAARMVAARGDVSVLTKLREEHARELRGSEDVQSRVLASARFHQTLVKSCGNNSLIALIGLLSTIIDQHHALVVAKLSGEWQGLRSPYLHLVVEGHEHLLALLARGDSDGAEQLWREHMRESREWTDQLLGDNRSSTLVELLNPLTH